MKTTFPYFKGPSGIWVTLHTYLPRKNPLVMRRIATLRAREWTWLNKTLEDDQAVAYLCTNVPQVVVTDAPRESVLSDRTNVKNTYTRYLIVPDDDWFIFSMKFGELLVKG